MTVLICGTAAEAAVVCVGLDGHVDFEIATTGCCSVDLGDPAEKAATKVSAVDSCAGCVDLGLDVESLRAAKEPLPEPERTISRQIFSADSTDGIGMLGTEPAADHDWVSDVLSSVILLT